VPRERSPSALRKTVIGSRPGPSASRPRPCRSSRDPAVPSGRTLTLTKSSFIRAAVASSSNDLLHDVAPMTSGLADREQNRPVSRAARARASSPRGTTRPGYPRAAEIGLVSPRAIHADSLAPAPSAGLLRPLPARIPLFLVFANGGTPIARGSSRTSGRGQTTPRRRRGSSSRRGGEGRLVVRSLGALLFALGTMWLASPRVGAPRLPEPASADESSRDSGNVTRNELARPSTRLLSGLRLATPRSAESDRVLELPLDRFYRASRRRIGFCSRSRSHCSC